MRGSIRGVVFDLDGTLAETHPMAIEHIGESIARHGGPTLSPDEVVAMFGPNEKGIFREVLGPAWKSAWDWYIGTYVEKHSVCTEPFSGIAELLTSLERLGLGLAVVSGKTTETARLSLQVLGLELYFSHVLGGAMGGVNKRHCIAEIIEQWRLEPGETAYVGDTPTDVVEASAAGVTSVGVCWSSFSNRAALEAAGPDELFESVHGFREWMVAVATSA